GQMTISQLVPFARSAGLGAAAATLALPVSAAGNAGGRILSGWLSDAFGRLTTLRTMVLVSAVAMPALFAWREQAVLFFVRVAFDCAIVSAPTHRPSGCVAASVMLSVVARPFRAATRG